MLKMTGMSINTCESLSFYKYLCNKIGYEEAVRTRRLALVISDIGQRNDFITSGSQGEGFNLKYSDLDIMQIDPGFTVYESEAEVVFKKHRLPLIMNTEETQPCFTQLHLPNPPDIQIDFSITIQNMFQEYHMKRALSSELFKLFYLSWPMFHPSITTKVHGPCITDEKDRYDYARCLKCDQWITRPRTSWPSPKLISNIISCGVLFVPIGCKGSINEHLEWRISFSIAEKFLIFSFSHTQLLCNAMLKIVLKEIVERHEDLKGLLCSYFLKTLMFWISEEIEPCVWRPDNIIQCFMACLKRLLYCVKYLILSHYFIPDNNLFFLRFNTYNKEKMFTILMNLYEQRINCFASSETLQDYQGQSYEITESLVSGHISFFQQTIPILCTSLNHARVDRYSRLLYNFLHHTRNGLTKGLFALHLSRAFMFLPASKPFQYIPGNRHNYGLYKRDLSHLIIGLHLDAVSGLLLLATFSYVHKNYKASLTVITYLLQKYTDEKISISLLLYKNSFTRTQKNMLNLMKKENVYTIIKSLLIHPFRFQADGSIVPQELKVDGRGPHDRFNSLSLAHFLRFLCYYHLHDITSCRQSLERLEHLRWTLSECGIVLYYPENLSTDIFCGIAFQLMGEPAIARKAFQIAAKLDKDNLTSAASRLRSLI